MLASRSRAAIVAVAGLAALVLLLGLVAEWAFARTGAAPVDLGRDMLVGWAFVAAGVVAWWRQPGERWWVLMLAEAVTWYLPNLQGLTVPAIYAVGQVFGAVNQAVLIHLVLAYPTGRLTSRAERLIVTAAYGLAVAGGLLTLGIRGPSYDPYRCAGCTAAGIVPAWGDQALAAATVRGMEGLGALLAVAALVAIARRWWTSTLLRRRVLAPVWLSMLVCGMLAASHVGLALPVQPSDEQGDTFVWVSDLAQLVVPLGFLAAVVAARLARAAVSEVVLTLGPDLSPARLQDALVQALHDPSLQLTLWNAEAGRYTDVAGRAIPPPRQLRDRGVALIEREGRPLGAIVHDPAIADEPRLVDAAVAATRLGLETERRHGELRTRLEQVEASRARILEAVDAERRRVERDLHDGAQQRLVSLTLRLRSALASGDREPDPTIQLAVDELQQGLAELRELARGIHPAILTQRGLAGAVESLAVRMAIPVRTAVAVDRCPPAIEAAAYFVVCEALTNVARHSRARAATICAERRDGRLVLEISDDGVGGADPARGSGLSGLVDRVAAFSGSLTVVSPSGVGTIIRVELPCE
jgi:signal transduction histidine kinase